MSKPDFTHNDFQIIKQCVENATFQGSSVRMIAALLDKVDLHLTATTPKQ